MFYAKSIGELSGWNWFGSKRASDKIGMWERLIKRYYSSFFQKSKEYLLHLFNEATSWKRSNNEKFMYGWQTGRSRVEQNMLNLTYKTTFSSTIKVNSKKRTRSTKQSSKYLINFRQTLRLTLEIPRQHTGVWLSRPRAPLGLCLTHHPQSWVE